MKSADTSSSRTESAAAVAYRAIERMIVTLQLAPSSSISETDIVQLSGFGRTPVREALQRLAWEGFVQIRPRSGITVAPINASDWVKVIDARRGAERLLACSAAVFAGETDLSEFRETKDRMLTASRRGDVTAFLDADKRFDEILGAAADNVFAARLAAPLQTHSRRFWYRYRASGNLRQAADHHVEIIDAIVKGDRDRAGEQSERLMAMLRAHATRIATL